MSSSRIAHRPRYRTMRQLAQASQRARQDFLSHRWMYRNQNIKYEKHSLGYQLSLLPVGYRFLQGIFTQQA